MRAPIRRLGERQRQVPVSTGWAAQFGDYLAARGADQRVGIAANVFHTQIKAFFAQCAARPQQAANHWLRHTYVSHALDAGAPVQLVQANAGHASLQTTFLYVTTDDARRVRAMRDLWSR